jgi:glycolate oxidase FAD binding subunit
MTVSVKPGTRLIDLQAQLADHNQFLPIDPAYPVVTTIGGMVASAASGYLTNGYGTVRDLLIGLEVLDTSGHHLRGGGKVVKNVTGYDLPKLLTGSNGQLGIFTKLTFRVMPKPEARASVVATGVASSLINWMIELRAPMDPVASVIVCKPSESTDYGTMTFHGATEAVTAAAFSAATITRTDVSAQAYEGEYLPDPIEGNLVVRVQALPTALSGLVEAVRQVVLASGGTITILPLTGRLGIAWSEVPEGAEQLVSRIAENTTKVGGSWFLDEAPIALRTVQWCGPKIPASTVTLNTGIRAAFDPVCKLNASRFGT